MNDHHYLAFLIAGCQRMEEASQIELYRQYYSYAMSICYMYTNSREAAQEMVNDGFLKVFKKIHLYKTEFDFKPWLRKVFVNAAIDHFRKYKKHQQLEVEHIVKADNIYNEALDRLNHDDLLKIMQSLSPAYRLVFSLFVVEGLSHDLISKKLGISIGASKSNLSKARKKIKELLVKTYGMNLKF